MTRVLPIRVLLADPYPATVWGLGYMLAAPAAMTLVGSAAADVVAPFAT